MVKKLAKKGFKTITVSEKLYEFLEKYRKNYHLRSLSQAIEFLAREGGHEL